jgi:hypothetical protein
MTDILDKEISGAPVTVDIGDRVCPLAYPMHNVILYKQKTGDSLFDSSAWPKIDLQADPERWLACLWAGLHVQWPDKSWKSPFSLDELGGLVDFGNAALLSVAMVKALTAFMPKAKDAPPNVAALGEPAPQAPFPTLRSSTHGLEVDFVSPETIS